MHDTARLTGSVFFEIYSRGQKCKVLDVGSMDVNGTLREFAPAGSEYIGIDLAPGPGVDHVLDGDTRSWPWCADSEFDLAVSTSCFEHDNLFWLTFSEMCRVVRPGGFIYLSAPALGPYHTHPVDNWRFYPDAGLALEEWAQRCGHNIDLIESFMMPPRGEGWTDFVAVFGHGGLAPQDRIHKRFPEALEVRPVWA